MYAATNANKPATQASSAKNTTQPTKGEKILNGAQTALDVAGLVPGLGEIANGINAAIYATRGDYVNATLSAAAMVPN
jgi:hypothetical protein